MIVAHYLTYPRVIQPWRCHDHGDGHSDEADAPKARKREVLAKGNSNEGRRRTKKDGTNRVD